MTPSGVVRRSLPHREDPFATLQGKVIDADNGEPVERANIRLNDNQRWTLTDENGMFAFENLGAGAFEIEVTRIGYHRAVLEPVVIRSGESAEVEIELDPDPIRLSEVTVTPGQFSFLDGGANPAQTLSRDEIESVPQIADDVFRAVNRLPGLASGDYSAHFGIRGGRHDETLILLDGLEIYEPYHLKDFDEGAISIIDGETVDGVDLLTGGFSPKYGNRRSGVLRIRSRRVEDDQTRALGGLSFVNARGLAMGRLPNGGGQWMASARSGYLDLILGFVKAHDLPSPSYHDLFGKLELDLHPRHTLLVDALHAGDRYEFNATATTGYLDSLETRESATNRYGNSYLWSTWTAHWTDRAFSRTRASVGLVTRARDGFESYLDRSDPLYSVREDRDLLVLGIAQDWTLDPGERWSIELGFDLRGLQGKQTLSTVVGQDPNDPAGDPDGIYPYRVDAAFDKSGTTFASYASQRWRPFDRMVVDAGVRYDHADYTRDRDWSPRTGLALQIGSANTLRLGWGHYRQMQRIDDVSVLDPDQSYFASELSSQWTVGLEHAFPDDSHLRIEAYDKRGSDLRPQYRNWKGGVDTFPESNEDRIRVYPSASRAQGLEIYYDRQFRKHLQVRASYAFSHAEETVSRIDNINVPYVLRFDAIHDAPMDQRHALNLDCSVPLSALPEWGGGRLSLGLAPPRTRAWFR
ncbi:MAG: TonB-dependent receptor [Candidatus Eisenbacteria bacterium]